jgi:hypothetical protein
MDDEESKVDPSFDVDLKDRNEREFKNVLLSSLNPQNMSPMTNTRLL